MTRTRRWIGRGGLAATCALVAVAAQAEGTQSVAVGRIALAGEGVEILYEDGTLGDKSTVTRQAWLYIADVNEPRSVRCASVYKGPITIHEFLQTGADAKFTGLTHDIVPHNNVAIFVITPDPPGDYVYRLRAMDVAEFPLMRCTVSKI
jgi:hypothetical protein